MREAEKMKTRSEQNDLPLLWRSCQFVGIQSRLGDLVTRAGIEPISPVDHAQIIDFTKRQKRQNRYFRRIEVHGGYTGYEFVSSRGAQ
jgi:hypothetical protein